jgi:hypothetical protein
LTERQSLTRIHLNSQQDLSNSQTIKFPLFTVILLMEVPIESNRIINSGVQRAGWTQVHERRQKHFSLPSRISIKTNFKSNPHIITSIAILKAQAIMILIDLCVANDSEL